MGVIDTLTEIRSGDCTDVESHVGSVLYLTVNAMRNFATWELVVACVLKSDISSCSGSFQVLLGGMESS